MGEVSKGFEPACAEELEAGFLKETCVEGVSDIDEIQMLKSERGYGTLSG